MIRTLIAILLTLACRQAAADPGYYVVTAYPDAGRRAVEWRYWTVKFDGRPVVDWPEVGVSYGISSRWTTGFLASWIGGSAQATRLSNLNWTNDILLTQGEWPVDVALHVQWIRTAEALGGGQAVEIGPVLQTDVERTQLNANMFFERAYDNGRSNTTKLKYQWQVKQRAHPAWQFGLQGFGEVGPWDRWLPSARQSHRAGPALFGIARLDSTRDLNLQGAWLAGRVYGRSGSMLTLRAQVVF